MKYILIIFIFASFLFSQVTSTNSEYSVRQVEGLDAAGRPINTQLNITMIQNYIQK